MPTNDEKAAAAKAQEDELAARRSKTRPTPEQLAGGGEAPPEEGKSVEELEADGGLTDEGDGQFAFEVPVGPRGKDLAWKDLVPRGIPVEHRVALTGRSIANPKGGLLDPNDLNGLLLVSYVLDYYKPQYVRDGDGKIEKVVLYAVIKPKHVVNARSEAGEVLLHGEQAA